MTISFSIAQILRKIKAESALRAYLNQYRAELPILTPDLHETLRMMAVWSFTSTVSRLGRFVNNVTLPDEGDIMEVKLTPHREIFEGSLLAKALENAIADHALAEIWKLEDPKLAATYNERWNANLANVGDLLSIPPEGLRIRPYN